MYDFKYDIVDKKVIIHEGTKKIPREAFKNNINIEEVVLPDSIKSIEPEAFMNCKSLKKINLPSGIDSIGPLTFAYCKSLEEITIPTSLTELSPFIFCGCINLKKVNIHDNIYKIHGNAFDGCKNIQNFKLPKELKYISGFIFSGCESIKEIHIPKNCEYIETGAFAYMSSLEKITVDKENKKYTSVGNNSMLLANDILIQYAIGSKYKEVCLFDSPSFNESNKDVVATPHTIVMISDYAFAGAKNLKKLNISNTLSNIFNHVFNYCENLKELEIIPQNNRNCSLRFSSDYDLHDTPNNAYMPFELIKIGDGIKYLYGYPNLFKNAKKIILPNTLESIKDYAFYNSTNLKEIKIPNSIKQIQSNSINKNTTIFLDKIEPIKGSNFNFLYSSQFKSIKIVYLKDDIYYIYIDNKNPIKTNKKEILSLTKNNFFSKSPDSFISYLMKILEANNKDDSKIDIFCKNEKLKELFIKFRTNPLYKKEISEKNYNRAIRELLNIKLDFKECLFGDYLHLNDIYDIEILAKNYNEPLDKFLKYLNVISIDYFDISDLINYCNLLEKYKKYDSFLYDTAFIEDLTIKDQELLIKHFNKNIKRLFLKLSKSNNLNDFMNMCNALGVFSDNHRLSQKMSTFIIEKLIESHIHLDDYKVHSIFDTINPRDEIDYEFIEFFIDNYKELFNLEVQKSGSISRIYNNFREISDTSLSNRGNGRHLKVTIDKCMEFFALKKFNNINKNNRDLALFLQKFYSESESLDISEKILEESKKAPRNIFVNHNNPCNDLKEEISDNYSFEWLPKQDWNNLVLGKYCNCCAHIQGAGQGIMRASMILDNCQNLVVKDDKGKIISKATIYVNKKDGYAVFNTIETSLAYRSEKDLKKIYKAILRGSKAFIEEYNKNNIDNKIKTISVGTNRNSLLSYLDDNNHPNIDRNKAINFGDYSLEGHGYNGDWNTGQRLILKI